MDPTKFNFEGVEPMYDVVSPIRVLTWTQHQNTNDINRGNSNLKNKMKERLNKRRHSKKHMTPDGIEPGLIGSNRAGEKQQTLKYMIRLRLTE